MLREAARTAQQAADALGVPAGAIAKSLVFRGRVTHTAVLVVASGDHRVDEALVGGVLGEAIERADPAFVREHTGYAIGGVPPLAYARRMVVFVDRTLARFPVVWAAAGTPHAVFPVTPAQLLRITEGTPAGVVVGAGPLGYGCACHPL